MAIDLEQELRRTQPDFAVYVPDNCEIGRHNTGNEHLLVFDGPDGSLMAVWTQGTREKSPDQHVSFTQSLDGGRTWSEGRILAGPRKAGTKHMANFGFPLISRSGRIYVLYNQHIGKYDTYIHHAGLLTGIYSDDAGATWSDPQTIGMPRSKYDNPDSSYPPEWVIWQRPDRVASGRRYIVGLSRWASKAVRYPKPIDSWIASESVVEFLRFENVDDDPEPEDLQISFLAQNDDAIRVGYPGHPELSVVQEPSVVRLPDGRLFCVMRTSTGHPWWTQSCDDGDHWESPRVLRQYDNGPALLHPLAPAPIYDLQGPAASSGSYALFIHNNDGHYNGWGQQWGPTDSIRNRRPVYLLHGQFSDDNEQPVVFDNSELFMDQGDVGLGPIDTTHQGKVDKGTPGINCGYDSSGARYDLALYASSTLVDGNPVLWYPDRKFFLLGKYIPCFKGNTPAAEKARAH